MLWELGYFHSGWDSCTAGLLYMEYAIVLGIGHVLVESRNLGV